MTNPTDILPSYTLEELVAFQIIDEHIAIVREIVLLGTRISSVQWEKLPVLTRKLLQQGKWLKMKNTYCIDKSW